MIYGLIGEKLGHSYSKEIHGELGQKGYEHFELAPGEVAGFVKREDVCGLNVTIPYKKTVMPLCDELAASAAQIGSVNTLVYDKERRLCGYNTDYDGFCYMVRRAGISMAGKKVLILGTGGTSLTARAAVRALSAGQIVIASRRPAGAGGENPCKTDGARETDGGANGAREENRSANGAPITFITYDEIDAHRDAGIIVNTTPVGMYPDTPAALVHPGDFPQLGGVVDVIYNPHRTQLVQEALELGIPATDGLPMLVAQAKAAEEYFTGKKIPDSEVERILSKLRFTRDNIVLVGMPGSGKSSIGMAVAAQLARPFSDIDALIEKRAGKPIPQIFEQDGEAQFRRLESRIIAEEGKRSGIVLATGGGAVLREENYLPLRQNGTIFQIERALSELSTEGRPLSKSAEALAAMYDSRLPAYRRFADHVIVNSGTVEEAAAEIIRLLS